MTWILISFYIRQENSRFEKHSHQNMFLFMETSIKHNIITWVTKVGLHGMKIFGPWGALVFPPAYHIERSVFELNWMQSNVNQTIKFDFVWSSNKIKLTKNKSISNQIKRWIKPIDVWFSSVAEQHLSERLTSSHDMIWIEQMFGFPSFDYHGDKSPGKCVNRSSHLKLCFLYFHTYFFL